MTAPAIVSRETSVLRPQPTMVGWGLSVLVALFFFCGVGVVVLWRNFGFIAEISMVLVLHRSPHPCIYVEPFEASMR